MLQTLYLSYSISRSLLVFRRRSRSNSNEIIIDLTWRYSLSNLFYFLSVHKWRNYAIRIDQKDSLCEIVSKFRIILERNGANLMWMDCRRNLCGQNETLINTVPQRWNKHHIFHSKCMYIPFLLKRDIVETNWRGQRFVPLVRDLQVIWLNSFTNHTEWNIN